MEERKVALFAFNGDPMCFAHVLLNALDMFEKGFKVKVVIEALPPRRLQSLQTRASPLQTCTSKCWTQA